ncbi:hypothetical protein ERO13_D04G174000v2 [Gossypium hirsutum]|uniref:Electron transporter n=3 Tax=Gossypium TaxID=3633 RepID=A0A1U8ISE0_GOSHI|nr:uncharacterized protein LOC107898335 [Gossypium hirsutum]KAB2036105.1 hypothetical protein ES319_D04G200200v1 [Gossypium barbadense]KAG4153265.1 hypothetical protein ERO13_D04G174000v2 [Gossypium hirsutum]TYG74793.1 hypothetical protein ES288_D04G211100v1 [Gossypium darwinii]
MLHLNMQMEFMEEAATHKRSSSFPFHNTIKSHVDANKDQIFNPKVQHSLKQEILQLEEQLQDQFVVRRVLEKALSPRPFTYDVAVDEFHSSKFQAAKELIKDIAVLELEIAYLEKYLLSLYRKMFDRRFSCLNITEENPESTSVAHDIKECNNDVRGTETLLDSSIYRSHSSLSRQSAYAIASPQKTGVSYHIPETPNWLSEEMIKTVSNIYFELADPPLNNHDCFSSPISYPSSVNDTWSTPQCFHVDNNRGPYCKMVKVQGIYRDSNKLQDIEHKLQYYRSLVYQLEEIDVRTMKHEEKLAFWINVHNSLVMHAYLVYGIPKNSTKRFSLLLKAAYNVGGYTISIETIQGSILGCKLQRPGQWLWFLFALKTKFKVGDPRRNYAIESPEPLLHFALCLGSSSDPAVRIYTPKEVFQELEVAKEEYIQANFSVNKEEKIELPKIMDYFAKDSDVCSAGLLQMLHQFMPQPLKKNLQVQLSCNRKNGKCIEWIPHNFAFQYLFSKELSY